MPRKVFDSIPEKLTGDDFVKVTEFLFLFHWDETVCLYKCPHCKMFALIPYSMYSTIYQNSWTAHNNPAMYGITAWYRTKADAVRGHYAYLHDCMVNGHVYAELKAGIKSKSNSYGGKGDNSRLLI